MKIRYAGLAALAGSMLLCFGLPAFAQDQVSVQFTGGYTTTWGNDSGDYGAGIYSANINGSPSASGMICDDFNDEITNGESWTANAYQASSLNSSNIDETLFGSKIGLDGYAEIGTLVSMMFGNISTYGSITGITQAELSSAIWDIGVGGTLQGLDGTATALVAAVEKAFGSNTSMAQAYLATLTNLWILTPTPEGPGEAQEMWISVPEGGAAFLYLLLAGLACFGAMFRNARKQAVERISV
jgi:hypothetical protein